MPDNKIGMIFKNLEVEMEIEIGRKYWWSRMGREGQFESLVKVVEMIEECKARVVLLVPQLKGQPPVAVERTCDVRYLRPFSAGDQRLWDRLPVNGQRSYAKVKVIDVEEESGLLHCECDQCPHHQPGLGRTLLGHRVLPHFIKNAAYIPRPTPTPAPHTAANELQPKSDRTIEVMKEVVLALAKGETPQPEDIDFLTGDLGKGLAYAVPAKS